MKNETLMDYINELAGAKNEESSLIFSTLDHLLTGYSWKKRMDFLSYPIDLDAFNKLSIEERAWLSAITEVTFNKKKKTPPEWVMNEDNKLNDLKQNSIYESFSKIFGEDKAYETIKKLLEKSLPEMKRRNLIADEVFNSF
jgi:hypothetical protein